MVVIRGTIWREEWCVRVYVSLVCGHTHPSDHKLPCNLLDGRSKDFQYRWAQDDAHLFPGRTHGA